MIKSNFILTKNFTKVHGILREFIDTVKKEEHEGELTINSIEKIVGETIQQATQLILHMAEDMLNNIETDKVDEYCNCCGKKLIKVKKDSETKVLSKFGYITIKRDILHCRRCHKGQNFLDEYIGLDSNHRMTKGMIETITYIAQLIPSFKRSSEVIEKLLNLNVSPTQMHIVSEEVGKKIFETEKKNSEKIYNNPQKFIRQQPSENTKEGILYILTDGSQINTRIEDKNGSTWKEMKLGLIFSDKDIIKRPNGDSIITKKEYVSYFGSVSEFKKLLFLAAIKSGYGKTKNVVIIGDGAQWIWNMCKELFPDAVTILDYYHLSENVHNYSKAVYPEDEVGRKRWVKQVLDKVCDNKVDEAMAIVEKADIKKPSATAVKLDLYMKNNKDRINYKIYKSKDYFIGSGAIESGNKVVIQQRMKQSGMRWSVSGGQYIATLRAKYESNKWDDVVNVINM